MIKIKTNDEGTTVNPLEQLAFIAAPSIIILFGLILLLISEITRPDPYEPPNPPRHLVPAPTTQHAELEIIEGVVEDLEAYPQVGRRGRYSAARNMCVADDWMPYIGDRMVTILTQATAEYRVVKQSIPSPVDPYECAEWATYLGALA